MELALPAPDNSFLKMLPADLRDGQGLRSEEDVYLMGATPAGDFALYKLDKKRGSFIAMEVEGYEPDTAKEGAGILKLKGGDTLHMDVGKHPQINGKPTELIDLQAPVPQPARPELDKPEAVEAQPHRFPEMKRDGKTPKGEAARMQEMLKDLGFGKHLGTFGAKKDGVDDVYGGFTANAVRAFQIANDILPTGDLDRRTAELLAKKHFEQQQLAPAGEYVKFSEVWTAGPSKAFNGMSGGTDLTSTLYQQLADSAGVETRGAGINIAALRLPQLIELPDAGAPETQRPRPNSPGMGGAS